MLIHSNNKPIRILGLGEVAKELKYFLANENIDSECIDVNVAMCDPKCLDYQYLIGIVRYIPVREKIINWITSIGANTPSFIHPAAFVLQLDDINVGTLVYPFASVLKSTLEPYQLFAPYTHIGHGSTVAQNCVFVPYSGVLGSVKLAASTVLQTRATVCDNVSILAKNTRILPGAMVSKDITNTGTYGGSPARYVSAETTLTAPYFQSNF